jgi:peptidoglycan hydrolase CwlO-like protein
VEFTTDGLIRAKELFEAMFIKRLTEQLSQQASVPISKYPNITVELTDLGNQLWPILRRVSYAMSDADVDDAEIEQYKNEVKSSDDPVAVSRRWVQVV